MSKKDNCLLIHSSSDNEYFKDITRVDPTDLKSFFPHGESCYGFQENPIKNPFKCAPVTDKNSALIFFDAKGEEKLIKDFNAFLSLMEIEENRKEYDFYALMDESQSPQDDGYICQMRIVRDFAMKYAFGIKDSYEAPTQTMSISEALIHFIECEIKRWGTSCFDNKGLWGKFGGDGDYMKEALQFGFTIENNYHGIYRIWSRAWLVTK